MTQQTTPDVASFRSRLADYKQVIDADIAQYVKNTQKNTLQLYGAQSRIATDAYLSILQRGGKRIRGALVMNGYEMSGGTNIRMIVQVARAVEMIHAYILIIDDIQDRSPMRRGGPTAHELLAGYHRKHHLADGPEHFGVSMALNAALVGNHAAQMLLANIDAPQELRTKVLNILNRTMMITAHGQSNDIMNEVASNVTEQDIERVLEWKTAHYTFLNPLHIGMVLAGAKFEDTDAVTTYAMRAGKAFQITDDILGVFGTEEDSGKSIMSDIQEGKRTILTQHALQHAARADKNFLLQVLGNQHITPEQFARCKEIFVETGSLESARNQAEQHIYAAIRSLEMESERWTDEGVQFLRGLAQSLLDRKA